LLNRWNVGPRTTNRIIQSKHGVKLREWGLDINPYSILVFVISQDTSSNKLFESSKNGGCYDMSYNRLNNEGAVLDKSLGQEGETQ
jgi:hypothetical protein